MADDEQLAVLRQGSDAWNAWRKVGLWADLSSADLSGADLRGADLFGADLSGAGLSGANLHGANLREADLTKADLIHAHVSQARLSDANLSEALLAEANLSGANLSGAKLSGANLFGANLSEADLHRADLSEADLRTADFSETDLWEANLRRANLSEANLRRANLSEADLSEANLSGVDLSRADVIRTNFTGAQLTGCRVYGIPAWNLKLEGAQQKNLIITPRGEPEITVDNLEVAQFIYLLLNNQSIRHVIDTITSKVVLILGRFTPERKAVLDALREELRQRDYTPVVFDFDKPASKDLTGTVQTLANMARFVIADLTDPSSVPHELAMVVPGTPVPVQPVLLEGQREYAMLVDLKRRHHWVLEPYCYASPERLLADLSERVIVPAEAKALELRGVSPPTA
jgi:uncharacterized protein YjbI with pentapeptide repeats